MAQNQTETVSGLISFGWTRMQAAPVTALLLKTLGLLAATMLALRLLASG